VTTGAASAEAHVAILDSSAIQEAAARGTPDGMWEGSGNIVRGDGWAALGLGDRAASESLERLRSLDWVERIVAVSTPFRLASRALFQRDLPVRLGGRGTSGREAGTAVGGRGSVTIVATLPARSQNERSARRAVAAGATVLHFGRASSPVGGRAPSLRERMAGLRELCDGVGAPMSVAVADARQIGDVIETADALVVEAHSMQDFSLLRELGRLDRPVVIKRASGATVEEFLLAAEYVLAGGNGRVILCDPGVRSFDAAWTIRFEINAIPLLKAATHLPVLADPSASASHPALIAPVSRAAVAAGADGVMLDLAARSGTERGGAIDPRALEALVEDLRRVAAAGGRPT